MRGGEGGGILFLTPGDEKRRDRRGNEVLTAPKVSFPARHKSRENKNN